MILVCALAALTTVLALAAHRRAWAAALGMVSGAAVVLAALVLDVSTRTILLCLLIPCAAAMWPIGGAYEFHRTRFCAAFSYHTGPALVLPPSRRWVLLLAASLGFTLWAVRRHFRCWRVSRWEPTRRHWASQKAKHRRPKSSG